MDLFEFWAESTERCSCDLWSNVAALYLQKKHITRWPFFVFLGGAMFCLLSSTTCHLFSCISPHCLYLLLWLDYTGIALLIAGSFYPLVLDPALSTTLPTVKSDCWKAIQFFFIFSLEICSICKLHGRWAQHKFMSHARCYLSGYWVLCG